MDETALSQDAYMVGFQNVQGRRLLTLSDRAGKPLFVCKKKSLLSTNTQIIAADDLQTVVGSVSHKVAALTYTFVLFDGADESKPIGSVKLNYNVSLFNVNLTEKLTIEDAVGNLLATAEGNVITKEFIIKDSAEGLVAKISKSYAQAEGNALMNFLSQFMKPYSLQILTQGQISTLLLLEFVVALENIPQQPSRPAGGVPFGGPMGGGGLDIKL